MRERIETSAAPAAIGPYSQGLSARGGRWVFTSGQVPLDPATGEMVEGGVKEQTRRALRNVQGVLEAGSAALGDVVKVTVFLTDMGHFAEMNEVYASFFPDPPPTRSTVAVRALPKGALVEVEALALVP